MSIPESPQFEMLLKSIQTHPPTGSAGWLEEILIEEERVLIGSSAVKFPPVRIWYQNVGSPTIGALLRKIEVELRHRGHAMNAEIARVLLAFFAHSEMRDGSAVPKLNKLFEHVGSADVNQYFLFSLPGPPESRLWLAAAVLPALGGQKEGICDGVRRN